MKLLTPVISIVGIACCAALLAFSVDRASPITLNTALTDTHFISHLAKYSKSYASMQEYSLRAGIFRDNHQKIRQLNLEAENNVTFDVNHMADWTTEEYKRLLGFKKSPLVSSSYVPPPPSDGTAADMPDTVDESSFSDVPPSPDDDDDGTDRPDDTVVEFSMPGAIVDYRNRGIVSPPFDIGACWGADYAIVAKNAMESAYRLKKYKKRTFSLQQIIDCARFPNYYCHGCNGGDP